MTTARDAGDRLSDGVKVQQPSPRDNEDDSQIEILRLSLEEILGTLSGVALAVGESDVIAYQATQWFTSADPRNPPPLNPSERNRVPEDVALDPRFKDWVTVASYSKTRPKTGQLSSFVCLALGIAGLCASRRQELHLTVKQVEEIIALIDDATLFDLLKFQNSRFDELQRYAVVPLCTLHTADGLQQHFELHVWLPDEKRIQSKPLIVSFSSNLECLTIAGVGFVRTYRVESVDDTALATHETYLMEQRWQEGSDTSTQAHMQQAFVPTGKLVQATLVDTVLRTDNSTYCIPKESFHSICVESEVFHAVIISFESKSSSNTVYGLSSVGMATFTQYSHLPAEENSIVLDSLKNLCVAEDLFSEGRLCAEELNLEIALSRFNFALWYVKQSEHSSQYTLDIYNSVLLGEQGKLLRRYGRFQEAKLHLERALGQLKSLSRRIDLLGELSATYSDLGLLHEAKGTAQAHFDASRKMNYEPGMTKATGLMGISHFLMSRKPYDNSLMMGAIEQLSDYVAHAQLLKTKQSSAILSKSLDPSSFVSLMEAQGLAYLSLCHTLQGDSNRAQEMAKNAMDLSTSSGNSAAKAISLLCYVKALLCDGSVEEALSHFRSQEDSLVLTLLSMRPSAEHLEYLQELSDIGVNLYVIDSKGYSTLDHAVFNNSVPAQNLILDSALRDLGKDNKAEVERIQSEAILRCDYRNLLQEKLRPALFRDGSASRDSLEHARQVYAEALATDSGRADRFDELKFVWYSDFLHFGKLPRSSDGLTCSYKASAGGNAENVNPKLIVFFSYRWLQSGHWTSRPDDENNTQYKRMIEAIEIFLDGRATGIHFSDRNRDFLKNYAEGVRRKDIGIWMDYACVDQDKPAKGVQALPLILLQCDMAISLESDDYYSRAWCTLEAQMAEALSRAGACGWFLHNYHSEDGTTQGQLRKGNVLPSNVVVENGLAAATAARGSLTFEERDRPKVSFLERQIRFLKWYEKD